MKELTKIPVMVCDKPNRNGRIYSSQMMEKEVKRFQDEHKDYSMLGCFEADDNHIYNDMSFEYSLSDASHAIKNLYMENNIVYADLTIVDTPRGTVAQTLLENGFDLSLKVIGTCEKVENNNVKDFHLQRLDLINWDNCGWTESKIKNE